MFQGLSGFAVLAAGLWAGFLWGVDGRLPLLISGGPERCSRSRCWPPRPVRGDGRGDRGSSPDRGSAHRVTLTW
ncbi:major facilitator superfamily MFS_1 domain protein [Mycobacterium ulcerans str. Harvey]|uniref:Major facilitator superfamily MFS_1 domain protein n=1 Tax=Mycobacterium ulcerans str. Harvey TaxID=1299332 RepID=A0ABN0QLJ2_MYCUL|nr:major facilitator superfamily MFS_1 domain protein [Mycobacterium ulcerans str. Harvey]